MRKPLLTLLSVLLAAIIMNGCGGNMSQPLAPAAPVTASRSTTATVINIGDDPSDSVLAFEVTIQSIVLTDSTSQQVSVLAAPARIELTRLAGTFAPLAHISIPQGTYTSAAIT